MFQLRFQFGGIEITSVDEMKSKYPDAHYVIAAEFDAEGWLNVLKSFEIADENISVLNDMTDLQEYLLFED